MRFVTLVIVTLFSLSVNAQILRSADPYRKQILEQANKMAEFMLKKDYAGFTNYSYPELLRQVGGKEKMIAIMENSAVEMEKGGYSFKSIKFGEPFGIFDTAGTLQSLVEETLTIGTPKEDVINSTFLIAVSNDNGKTWTFIDAANKEKLKQIRSVLPEISNKLRYILP